MDFPSKKITIDIQMNMSNELSVYIHIKKFIIGVLYFQFLFQLLVKSPRNFLICKIKQSILKLKN